MASKRTLRKYRAILLLVATTGFIVVLMLQGNLVVTLESEKSASLNKRKDQRVHDPHDYLSEKFRKRRDIMLGACKKNATAYIGHNSEGTVRNHFVVDRKHRFVYCAMEKIGSTFWRRLFQIISNLSKAKSPFDIPAGAALGGHVETFKTLSFDDIHSILGSSKKFVIARDPYARLYSGYMDKLFSANTMFWDSVGKFSIAEFRKNPSKHSLECGHDLTFPEFIKYFIHSETFNKRRDGHFLPMFDHCRPCQINYDIIAKMESLSEDTLSVLKILNMTKLHKTLEKQFTEDTREDSFRDQTHILFGSLKRTEKCLTIYKNQKRMWTKFQSRGLISKYAVFPFNPDESATLTQHKYINALKQAVKESSDKDVSNRYRYDFLWDAYAKVPKVDLKKLHRIMKKDCDVFGYDCEKHPWIENAFRQ